LPGLLRDRAAAVTPFDLLFDAIDGALAAGPRELGADVSRLRLALSLLAERESDVF
jgi:hypothetical protein